MVNNNTESGRISALETRLGELKYDVSQKFTAINDTLELLKLQTEILKLQTEMLREPKMSTRGKAPVEDREQAETVVQGKPESGLLATPSMGKQTLEAIDHIINSAAKSNYMSAGQISVPIVFRGPNGVAAGILAKDGIKRWKASILIFALEDKLEVKGGKCYDHER
ncbi:hypothetical protein ACS0TY_011245 [Phlomoides rotata]